MPATVNRQILLAETPKGRLGPEHFRLVEAAVPTPGDGEVLLRVLYISLDAANRAWMQGATYREAVGAGSVMAGGSISEVVESRDANFSAGDLAFADTGWQDYAVAAGQAADQDAEGRAADPSLEHLRHCRAHRLFRPAAYRAPARGRDGGGFGRRRFGRLAGRPDRQDQGLPRRRHRRRRSQMRLAVDELGFDAAVDYKAGRFSKS